MRYCRSNSSTVCIGELYAYVVPPLSKAASDSHILPLCCRPTASTVTMNRLQLPTVRPGSQLLPTATSSPIQH
jgi:hypothetical protein